ncbi:MAG: bifunctional YncE family protein/alkaline phosphatase family protein [Armatimonadota bacterium]
MSRLRSVRGGAAALVLLGGGVCAAAVGILSLKSSEWRVGPQEDGSYLVSSNQTVAPVGAIRQTDGARPKDLAVSPDGETVAVLTHNGVIFYRASDGTERGSKVPLTAGPLGVTWSPDGKSVYAAMSKGQIARIVPTDSVGDSWKLESEITINTVGADGEPDVAAGLAGRGARQQDPQTAGLAVSPDGRRLYAALGIRNAVAVLDLPSGRVSRVVPVGVAPYSLALSPDGKTLCVADRGGRAAKETEPSAPSAGTSVRVDPATDAAKSGSLSFIDTASFGVTTVEGGRQPAGMVFTPDGKTLYAASSDDDTVLAVDVTAHRITRVLPLRPREDGGFFGQIPTSVALTPNSKTLYVACGGANAVAVIDTKSAQVTGYIPTGWFPVAVAERNGTLFVASSKGWGSRAKRQTKGGGSAYGANSPIGLVQFVSSDARKNSADLTKQVAKSNRWDIAGVDARARKGVKPVPVPERVGEPSVFKHVVYIIKENHTYDSMFGDMPEGNGDKNLCLFGEEVTPNHHALAREFVLMDNTYTSGTNSADGHQWTSSGIANGYIEQNYAAHARSYPYDGGDPLAYSPKGFLWTAAVRAGKSVRVYGEFVNKPRIADRTTGKSGSWTELWQDYKNGMKRFEITSGTDNAALRPYLHPHYIGFPNTVSDQWRADQFLQDVEAWEKTGKMPDLSIMLLPNDHTMGTRPGTPTPRASVADNDLALGRIVERLTKSPFWKEMLILVIEDDSQLGLDHVDGHRTVALCISPYTRRGTVIHDTYNHTSFLRTMGRVLGFAPMTRFDRTATPLTACFQEQANLQTYTARPNKIPLDEMNPPATALKGEARRLAEASARLDWSDVDRADASVVSRAVWSAQRPGQPFPTAHYTPAEEEDEDEEE